MSRHIFLLPLLFYEYIVTDQILQNDFEFNFGNKKYIWKRSLKASNTHAISLLFCFIFSLISKYLLYLLHFLSLYRVMIVNLSIILPFHSLFYFSFYLSLFRVIIYYIYQIFYFLYFSVYFSLLLPYTSKA